jgi:Flp pilus assembly protein TadD
MSLLLDALKRAEQAKKAKSDETASGIAPSGVPPVPSASQRPAEKRVPYNGPERRELQLTDREGDVPPREMSASSDTSVPVQAAAQIRRANVSTPRALTPLPTTTTATEAAQQAAPSVAPSVNREIAKPVLVGRSPAAVAPASRPSRAPWLAPLIAVGFVAVGLTGWYGWQELSRALSTSADRVPQVPDVAVLPAAPTTGQIVVAAPPSAPLAAVTVIEPALPPLLPPPLPDVAPPRSTPITRLATAPNNPRELTERERLAQSLKQSPTGREVPVRLRLSQSIEAPKVSPELTAAYAALTRGDYVQAKNLYSQVVQTMPLNLDAHLGLAASSSRAGDNALAARHYRRALELDPRNSMAIAGLLAVSESAGGARPEALEAQLNALISKDPSAAPLQFALGNLYAGERRWTEAQQAFFEAYRLDAANADYLFNLAVSLDQLNQPRLAFDYYQKSLTQAAKTGAQFDRNVAQRRAAELQNLRVIN